MKAAGNYEFIALYEMQQNLGKFLTGVYLARDTNITLSTLEIVHGHVLELNPPSFHVHNLVFFIFSTFFILDPRLTSLTLAFRCSHPSDWAATAPQTFPPDQCFRPLSFLLHCLLTGLATRLGCQHTRLICVSPAPSTADFQVHIVWLVVVLSSYQNVVCKKCWYVQPLGGRLRPHKSILSPSLRCSIPGISPFPQYHFNTQ